MSKYTTIRCWQITDGLAEPSLIEKQVPTLRIFKKSILKTGYRAFASDERSEIENQPWYREFLLGAEIRFYIDGTGFYKLVNCDLVDNELYFERLNLPVGHKPWIFYSWQSDHNSSRSTIKEALEKAVAHINDDLNPRQKIELVEATRPEDGADDIVKVIKANLDKCLFAVFDITSVAKVPEAGEDSRKCYPNANVVFELSYAMARKRPDQVLLVKRTRADFAPDKVPFDFEHLKRAEYDRPAKLNETVLGILKGYLGRLNYIQSESPTQ
jgi:hypothetical protein